MRPLGPWAGESGLELLVIGAHPDDIEIGCGGTLLRWAREGRISRLTWLVLSGTRERADEARRSAAAFLADLPSDAIDIRLEDHRDGYFPYDPAIKDVFEDVKRSAAPDLILTHDRTDRHQDHRQVGELTWQTFRDHLVLEYEVPKVDGELGSPNAFVELPDWALERKVRLLRELFPSQAARHWFSDDTFTGLARLRGVECRAGSGYAEGYHSRKLVLS